MSGFIPAQPLGSADNPQNLSAAKTPHWLQSHDIATMDIQQLEYQRSFQNEFVHSESTVHHSVDFLPSSSLNSASVCGKIYKAERKLTCGSLSCILKLIYIRDIPIAAHRHLCRKKTNYHLFSHANKATSDQAMFLLYLRRISMKLGTRRLKM